MYQVSWALNRLQLSVNRLEGLVDAEGSLLGEVIPECKASVAPLSFPLVIGNSSDYPWDIQPFSDVLHYKAAFEIGRDTNTFGFFGPMLLSAIIKPSKTLNFKAFSQNHGKTDGTYVLTHSRKENNTSVTEKVIRTWILDCGIPESATDRRVFRRCIIIGFVSEFVIEPWSRHSSGHAITLGLEIKNRALTIKIFDYRMHEYVYNVHDRMFQWIYDAMCEYAQYFDTWRTETVCLKDRLHVNKGFMTCMSAAYRSCLYFSKDGDFHETDQDFKLDSENLQKHIFRIFEWGLNDRRLNTKEKTVIISPAMANLVYEINPESCYLLLVPYALPLSSFWRAPNKYTDKGCMEICTHLNYEKDRICLRYSIENGIVEGG